MLWLLSLMAMDNLLGAENAGLAVPIDPQRPVFASSGCVSFKELRLAQPASPAHAEELLPLAMHGLPDSPATGSGSQAMGACTLWMVKPRAAGPART